MKKPLFIISLFLALTSCTALVIDRSMGAIEAGDFTLALSACGAVPGQGMDICRVKEGTVIDSSWKMIVPGPSKVILGGEVDVYYRDTHHQYPITSSLVEIPWRLFFNEEKWQSYMDGEALALVLIRYKTDQGIEEIAKFRGIAKIVVTKDGYERMPIDSGFSAWGTNCKVQYSTQGRSALECKDAR